MIEETIQDSLLHLYGRNFYGTNLLPLPSYIVYALGLGASVKIYRFTIFCVAFLSKMIIGNLILRKHRGRHILSFFFAITCLYLQPGLYNDNYHFFELFICMSLLKSQNYLQLSILLGLAASSDTIGFVFQVIFLVKYFSKFFSKLSNPKIKCKDTILEFSKIFLVLLSIPVFLFVSILFADLEIRNNHSPKSYHYSIPFQSALKNFNIANGFETSSGHASATEPSLYTDYYVMDRSVISLVSTHHTSFFNFDQAVKSTSSFDDFCEIHKIHNEDFEDEGPRFIQNGDYVKLQSIISKAFIGVVRDDGDKKFIDLKYGEFEDDEDIWEVECDGYLRARESLVRFKSTKTGDYLSVRKIKSQASIFASYYSSHNSRNFYIAGNKNHDYFIDNFEDPRAASKTKDFPKLNRFKRLLEFLKGLKFFSNDLKNGKNMLFKQKFTAIAGVFIAIFLMANHISKNRYNLHIVFSELTNLISICSITVFLSSMFFGLRLRLILSLCNWLILSFAVDLADNLLWNSKVYPMSWNKNK